MGIIYGYHETSENTRLWQELLDMKANSDVLLFLMGDFNEVRQLEERKRSTNVTNNMVDFDTWINNMGLIELPIISKKIYIE